jgi:EAL and modified HD-GYP domain-containing signal transduction protein
MAEVVPALALTDELNGALLHHQGELGNVLHCVQAYERREWSDVKAGVALDSELIEKAYLESLVWSAGVLGLSRRITT